MKYSMKQKEKRMTIKDFPFEDRPREKLIKYGAQTLSNAELLAILLGTGSTKKSAVDIGRQLLFQFKTLRAISEFDISEFSKIDGIKNAKISNIKAAFELGKRLMSEEKNLMGQLKSSSEAANFLIPLMRDLKKEIFKILLLDNQNNITDIIDIRSGSINGVKPPIRDILLTTLKYQSPSIILVHNHPSGDVKPSESDKSLTKELIKVSIPLELKIFDHIIIGENKYFSFDDEGLIEEYEIQVVRNM